ncbi:MAG TPA: cytochrome c3 family protein [Bryobacteraceae bacterium]|nr:cytochrome c3 family protein [Bryobacteraceae bacterium]
MRREALLVFFVLPALAPAAPTCAVCHQRIAESWMHTGMARSLARPAGDEPHRPVTVHNPAAGRYDEIFRDARGLQQSEYQLDPDGKTIFRVTYPIEWVVGSGTTGHTYIVRRGGSLFQAPLSFYARRHSWALSPGYEHRDQGFNRPILPVCVSCHGGVSGQGIGCRDCHGDGQTHAASGGAGVIVNPAKLPSRLAEDVCMRCHQDGDARILQPGKREEDFRPGRPLAETVALFKVPGREAGDAAELLDHHFAMRQSRCFTASAGRLGCLTCHDPHAQPSPAQAAAWYRSKCLGCHAESACSLPRARRGPDDDCAACHMPRRDLRQVSHAALTLHRIVRRLGQPVPEAPSNLPDLVYLNGSPGDLPRVTLLQAYAQLADRAAVYQAHYLELLEEVRRSEPRDPFVLAAVGRKALREGDPRAVEFLEQAVAAAASPVPYQDLAEALTRAGRGGAAVQVLRRGLDRFPFEQVLWKRLASGYIALGQHPAARDILVRYLDLFPEDTFMREMLRKFDAAYSKRSISPR